VIVMADADESSTDAAAEQLRRIASVTDAALARLTVDELLAELLDRIQDLLSVDTVAVLLLDAAAEELVATAAKGIEAEVRQGVRIPLGRGFAGRVAAERRPVILPQVDRTTVLNPLLWEHGIRSLLGVPLMAGGALTGVLHVGTITHRQFTDDDVRLLQIVGDRIAYAVEARQAQAERDAASLLQRSLLPARLPAIPNLELAARYVPGESLGFGGDWYDVFSLPAGGWCVVIGDVVGRGFVAAEAMGRLRSALRAHALYSAGPAEALSRLNEQIIHFHGEHMIATVQVAMLEPSLDIVRLSSAGHPPPVLAAPAEDPRLLRVHADPPIGIPCPARRTVTFRLAPGSVLCLYTDGLIERRDAPLLTGLERLQQAVGTGSAEAVCSRVMARLIGGFPAEDDTAVLVLRRVPADVAGAASGLLPDLEVRPV
jgi:putative methionine-R-sulfoxide reductase with GAF domain